MEMITVRSSVEASLEDLRMIGVQSRLRIKESDDNDTVWLKKLIGSIYAVELVTGIYVKRAAGIETSIMSIPLMDVPFVGVTPTTWTDAIQEAKEAGIEKESLDERIVSILRLRPHSRMAFALLVILRLGTTPRLREDLRSRLLSHQVSMASSSAKQSSQTLRQLLEQQAEVKVQLEELICLITMANQRLVRLESSNDRVSTEDTQ
ncbi:unnamed protein product [Alternaria alternata]